MCSSGNHDFCRPGGPCMKCGRWKNLWNLDTKVQEPTNMCLMPSEIREDYYKDIPDTPKIRTPVDILAEEAAKLLAEQDDFRALVNKRLPRKHDDVGKVVIWGRSKTVYEPIVTELKSAGWIVYISYNDLCIEFPKG